LIIELRLWCSHQLEGEHKYRDKESKQSHLHQQFQDLPGKDEDIGEAAAEVVTAVALALFEKLQVV